MRPELDSCNYRKMLVALDKLCHSDGMTECQFYVIGKIIDKSNFGLLVDKLTFLDKDTIKKYHKELVRKVQCNV